MPGIRPGILLLFKKFRGALCSLLRNWGSQVAKKAMFGTPNIAFWFWRLDRKIDVGL